MRVDLDISGIEEIDADLHGMIERAKDQTPAMEAIQAVMIRSAQKNFEMQGRPDPWQPLSLATIKRRRNKDKGSVRILRDTGYLMQSLSPQGGQYSIREVTKNSVAIGTNRPGAAAHQEGNGRLPARPFLIHQEEDIDDYKTIILDHVTGFGE